MIIPDSAIGKEVGVVGSPDVQHVLRSSGFVGPHAVGGVGEERVHDLEV
jgi:hypothetical protein